MNGIAESLIVFVTIAMIASDSAIAQQFSQSSDYERFYASRYDAKLDNEATIAIWWLIEKFSDTHWSRQQLHDELCDIQKVSPNSTEHVIARDGISKHLLEC